jgi:hypothetical protein
MAQVFEIFNAVDGKTAGYRFGIERAKQTVERCSNIPNTVYDYLPAREGFYILDMRDNVKIPALRDATAVCFPTEADAQGYADFQNQGSDTNSFRVFEQVL